MAYDCKSMRLLPACKLPGGYKFAGVSRKEEVVTATARSGSTRACAPRATARRA
ncbi:hypothetical protein [Nannocystis pusilla]|uniref:hypothetical protein n=1 Tax=Nannocystis pusilla TaxID=889268 RepID=UPI003B7D3B3E